MSFRHIIYLFFIPLILWGHLFAQNSKPIQIVTKLKKGHEDFFSNSSKYNSSSALAYIKNSSNIKQLFPTTYNKNRLINNPNAVDISLIYQLEYSDLTTAQKAIYYLSKSQDFEYAELKPQVKLLGETNDSLRGSQFALTLMKAYQAYDIQQGDTNIVIGITDTGIELNHPDIKDNIKYNYKDLIDGLDNDNDGYIDNYVGWDLAQNDNNPSLDFVPGSTTQYQSNHGLHVAGISSATTNNNTGISGIGNKCKVMPIKIMDANGDINVGYESIVYAADHGCKIINCSWGAPGYSKFGQDIINYATNNANCLVIAAAGNDNNEVLFYPASYENVLSVTAINYEDKKWFWSSYNYEVDLSAPGEGILSLRPNGTYAADNGTSMAAPNAAGAAAIVWSQYKSFNALQVAEQLKASADYIDSVNNPVTWEKMGSGRINLFKAVSDTSFSSIIVQNIKVSESIDDDFRNGDTLLISCDFLNLLSPSSTGTATLTSNGSSITILNPFYNIGYLGTNQKNNNSNAPFKVLIKSNGAANQKIDFILTTSSNTNHNKKHFSIYINKDYINISNDILSTTVTSKGLIGYNDADHMQGQGLNYKNHNDLMYECSFMVGNSTSQVSDYCRRNASVNDMDFAVESAVTRNFNSASETQITNSFNDFNAAANRLNVLVNQTSKIYSDTPNTNFILFEFSIVNIGTTPLGSVYGGVFADFDLKGGQYNSAHWDGVNYLMYTQSYIAGAPVSAWQLLNNRKKSHHYALDNASVVNMGIDITSDFTTAEKFEALSSSRDNAGVTGVGNDVCQVMSCGPFYMEPNDTITIAYALIVADSVRALDKIAATAYNKYNNINIGIAQPNKNNTTLYPNPATNSFMIDSEEDITKIEIYNNWGSLVKAYNLNGQIKRHLINTSELPKGVYFVKTHKNEGFSSNVLIIK